MGQRRQANDWEGDILQVSAHVINGEYEQTLSPVYGYRCITVSPATVNGEACVSIASNTFHSRDHLDQQPYEK